jgi:hypothetical protein
MWDKHEPIGPSGDPGCHFRHDLIAVGVDIRDHMVKRAAFVGPAG